MKHKEHPELRRLAVQSGATLARFALKGAEVNLSAITKLLTRDPETPRKEYESPLDNPRVVDELLWRTRAFFWELVGAFDMFLQWANDHFQLGLSEGDVKWSKMPNTSPVDQGEWSKMRAALENAYNSEWYFEIRTYRNYAHRSVLHVQALVPKTSGEAQVFLPHARRDQPYYEHLPIQMRGYLEHMRLLARELFTSVAQQGAAPDPAVTAPRRQPGG